MINGFFNSQYSELETIPFDKFKVEFDDQKVIEVVRDSKEKNQIIVSGKPSNKVCVIKAKGKRQKGE